MDTKWKRWINTLCIAVVLCLMAAGGVYGINGTNGAASLQAGVSPIYTSRVCCFSGRRNRGMLWRVKVIRGFLKTCSVN